MKMRDNLYSWFSGFTLSGISMYNGWITVESTIEVAFYGFIGGVVGMLGKWLVQHIHLKLRKEPSKKKEAFSND